MVITTALHSFHHHQTDVIYILGNQASKIHVSLEFPKQGNIKAEVFADQVI